MPAGRAWLLGNLLGSWLWLARGRNAYTSYQTKARLPRPEQPTRHVVWVAIYRSNTGICQPQSRFQTKQKAARLTLAITDIQRIIGEPLPPSARAHSAWWANDTNGKHVHANEWLNAGWKSASVSLMEERVTFFRD